MLTEIDHVAIAVNDLEAAIDYYQRAFGAEVEHREIVEQDGVEEALLRVADSYVQLLTPTRPDSPVAKALEKRGEGLHHVGYRVDDCAKALASVRGRRRHGDRQGAPARLAWHHRRVHPPQGELRHPHRARPGVTDRFYLDTLTRLLADGVVAPTDRLLVACGGLVDRDTLLAAGFTDVVITNLDERMDVYNEYAPFAWRHEDAEALTRGRRQRRLGRRPPRPPPLRLTASRPRRAAAGRAQGRHRVRGAATRSSCALACDSGWWRSTRSPRWRPTRAGGAVCANGPIPNHVYRWTEREVRKTVKSLLPSHEHDIRFAYGLRFPADRLGLRRLVHAAEVVAPVVGRMAPRQGNEFAFVIRKNVRPQPWLREG